MNSTPEGGSQAEALRVEPGERVVLRDATFRSRQATLLLSGKVYVVDSLVELRDPNEVLGGWDPEATR